MSSHSGRRRPRWHRHRRRTQRLGVITAVTVVVLLGVGLFALGSHYSLPTSSADLAGRQASDLGNFAALPYLFSREEKRVIYPYSVVPGGVHSPEELRQAAERDRVVGDLYEGFDYQQAKVVTVTQPKLVYLSYRMKDKIYWTKKKVALHKGEKLLTDGKMTARTRCANQVSGRAKGAVSPEEPPMALFEEPITADGGTATHAPFPSHFQSALLTRPFDGGFGPAGPPSGSAGLYAPGIGGGYPPISPPGFPIGGGGGTVGPPPPPNTPPPAVVPEPGTMLLVASGAAAMFWKRRKVGHS